MDAKQAKLRILELMPYFDRFVDKNVMVRFGKNELPMHFVRAEYAKIGKLHNKPEKRSNGDKNNTPPIMSLVFAGDDEPSLDIIIEDIDEIRVMLPGVILVSDGFEYHIEEL